MPLPRRLIEPLLNLRLIVTVGSGIGNLDLVAANYRGIHVLSSKLAPSASEIVPTTACTPELAWGLLMAVARHIAREDRRIRAGEWRSTLGTVLAGRTLGLLGLGNIGKRMARYAQAFDMNVIAWSQNLTPEAATAVGVTRVDKEQIFRESNIVSIHLILSERTRSGRRARAWPDYA